MHPVTQTYGPDGRILGLTPKNDNSLIDRSSNVVDRKNTQIKDIYEVVSNNTLILPGIFWNRSAVRKCENGKWLSIQAKNPLGP